MRLKRGNKYNARKVRDANGKVIAESIAEFDFSYVLDLREKAGEIRDVQKWPLVWLTEYVKYKPDYQYFEKSSNQIVYVDVKSKITLTGGGRFGVIKELWKTHGPGPLEIVIKEIVKGRWTGRWKTKRVTVDNRPRFRKIKPALPPAGDSKPKTGAPERHGTHKAKNRGLEQLKNRIMILAQKSAKRQNG